MKCSFCGSDQDNVKLKSALAEERGLVKLPVCPVDALYVDDTFSNPLTNTQLIRMQKASM